MVNGEYEAQVLVNEWLKRRPSASNKAQHISPGNEKTLIELFKYTAKQCSKGQKVMNAEALHIIYKSLKGVRTFQTLGGFGNWEIETDDGEELKLYSQSYKELKNEKKNWVWEGSDWKDKNDNKLTGYTPSEAIEKFSNSIETKLCNVTSANNNSPPNTIGKNSVLMLAANDRLSEEITMMLTEEIPY